MAALPYTISSGQDIEAEPVQADFDNLNVRLNSVESVIDNIVVDADTYSNGVFADGLAASEVGTDLVYSSGTAIVSHITYYKSTITVAFSGQAADTYYVEMDSVGDSALFTSHDAARTNLNTVVWNGSGFDSVTTADRNELATYQEIIDARDSETDLDARLDKIEDGTRREDKITVQTTSTLTLDGTHKIVNCNTTSNAIAITVGLANSYLGRSYLVYVGTVTSAYAVTMARSGSDIFIYNGVQYTGMTMSHYDFVELISVNTGVWLVTKQYGVAFT